jgi:hypothetical protein
VLWRSGGEWRPGRGVGESGVGGECSLALIQDVTGIDYFHLNKSLHRAICYHGVAPPQGGSVPFLSVEGGFVESRIELHRFWKVHGEG